MARFTAGNNPSKNLSKAERSARSRKSAATRRYNKRSAAAKRGAAKLTPAQRSERSHKAAATRRNNLIQEFGNRDNSAGEQYDYAFDLWKIDGLPLDSSNDKIRARLAIGRPLVCGVDLLLANSFALEDIAVTRKRKGEAPRTALSREKFDVPPGTEFKAFQSRYYTTVRDFRDYMVFDNDLQSDESDWTVLIRRMYLSFAY